MTTTTQGPTTTTVKQPASSKVPAGAIRIMTEPDPQSIHNQPDVQRIVVALYFPLDEDRETLLDAISTALQDHPDLATLIAAYEMVEGSLPGLLVPSKQPLA